jgi:TonB dependent receptor/CarboxypepD_reg-like domain/TonB-dependent Receptor Plug Domain
MLLLLILALALGPQTQTGHIHGVIVDARSGRPVARVRVDVQNSPRSTQTNDEGRFTLDVPAGTMTLSVSGVGYALTKREVTVQADATLDVTIPVSEGTGGYTEEVHVTGDPIPHEPGVPTEQTLGSADLQNLKNTLADDPMRAVQTLPGVAASDDYKAEFSVRGSDFGHIGVTLDGVPSPLLVHTVHGITDSGSLAMINSDILDGVTLQAGSYPERYGDRTGAYIEFRTREGSRDGFHLRLNASAAAASAIAEGPIGKSHRGSWLISARKSYLDWLVRRIDPDITGTFGFVDTHGKLTYDLSPRNTLQFNFVAGSSRFNERQFAFGPNSLNIGKNLALLGNLTLRSTVSPKFLVTQRVYGVSDHFSNNNPSGTEIDRGTQHDVSYRVETTFTTEKGLLVETGAHLQWLDGNGRTVTFGGPNLQTPFQRTFTGSATRQAAYGQIRWQPLKNLTLTPGARVDRWSLTGQTLGSPWLQGELGLPHSFVFAAGTGIYRQAPELEQVLGPRGSASLIAEDAWHRDIGIGQRLGDYRWQATFYARDEHHVLRLPDSEPRVFEGIYEPESFITLWENALRGRSRGFELFVTRRSVNGLSGWLGYSYADTHYTDLTTGETFVGDFDQRHTFNAYASYRVSDRTSVSARFRYGSNTPLIGYYYRESTGLSFLGDERNSTRLPTYSRLDLRANRTFQVSQGRLTLFLEVVNLYNRRNLRAHSAFVDPYTLLVYGVTEKLFPIIPSVGMTFEF